MYVSHGEVLINGAMLKSGDSYLLLPGEPHTYTYKKAENSRYYWMHFTGNKVCEVLSLCEISKGVNRSGGRGSDKDSILAMLTEELIGCADEASEYAVSLLFSFLSLFKRGGAKKRGKRRTLSQKVTITSILHAGILGTAVLLIGMFLFM